MMASSKASSTSIVLEDESDISNADSNNSSTSETSFETDVTQTKRKSDKERLGRVLLLNGEKYLTF